MIIGGTQETEKHIFLIPQTGKTAEYILLENGIFSRTISIKSVEELAKTGKAKGSLINFLLSKIV